MAARDAATALHESAARPQGNFRCASRLSTQKGQGHGSLSTCQSIARFSLEFAEPERSMDQGKSQPASNFCADTTCSGLDVHSTSREIGV